MLDEVITGVFDRLVTSLRGRRVALLLSGGYDSRLVAVNLRRAGHANVVCLSFGTENTREFHVAAEVARGLGYPWHLLDVPGGWLRERFSTAEFRTFTREAGGGVATPYYMGLLVERALDAGLVDRDTVVVTGNSGDLVEGAQMSARLLTATDPTLDDVVDAVIDRHHMLWGRRSGSAPVLRKLALEALGERPDDGPTVLSRSAALDLEERFNWRERQAKYVVQDARCYEHLGMDWRFPLWDAEFMDYWLQVPDRLRADRALYLSYVEAEPFRTANVTTLKQRLTAAVKHRSRLLTDLLYPVEKLRHHLRSGDPYYVVGLLDHLRILRLTGGHRTTTITTHIYRELREVYRDRLPDDAPRWTTRPSRGRA